MKYRFFGLDEDGTILEYGTSTEDGASIGTVPGKYSPLYSPVFKRKSGELIYQGLGEEGVENMTTTIVRYIPISDEKAEQEPMKSLKEEIRSKHMPAKVADELREKDVWHVIRGEGTEVQYNLANGKSGEEVTLRLDFTYVDGRLTDYVLKDYGYTEGMKAPAVSDWAAKLCYFAEDFAGAESTKYVDGMTVEEVSAWDTLEGKDGVNTIGHAAWLEEWHDEGREYYGDLEGAMYVWDERIGMVVGYDRNAVKDGDAIVPGREVGIPDRKDGIGMEAYGVRFVLPRGSKKVPLKQYVKDDRHGYSYKQHSTGELVYVMAAKNKKAFERDFSKMDDSDRNYWPYFSGNKEKVMAFDCYEDGKGKSYEVFHWKEKGVYFWVYGKLIEEERFFSIYAKDAAEIASSMASAK